MLVAVALPRLVDGLSVQGLHPALGPLRCHRRGRRTRRLRPGHGPVHGRAPAADTGDEPADLSLPAQSRLHLVTGVLGLVAAGAALVGADTSLFSLPADFPHPPDIASRPLIPAAVVIAVCAIGMLVPRWAAAVRPAFAVAWVAVPIAGTGVFDTALTATQIDGVRLGPGLWATGLAVLAALAAACCAGLAGGVERDDVDLTSVSWQPLVLAPGAAAALLAFGAFGFPVLAATGYTPPGLWSDFRFASWGLVFGLVAVIAAALLAAAQSSAARGGPDARRGRCRARARPGTAGEPRDADRTHCWPRTAAGGRVPCRVPRRRRQPRCGSAGAAPWAGSPGSADHAAGGLPCDGTSLVTKE